VAPMSAPMTAVCPSTTVCSCPSYSTFRSTFPPKGFST
jgi:hypothetical protein